MDRINFCKKYKDWSSEQWGNVIFSDEAPFRLFGTFGKRLVQSRKAERFSEACVTPTVKHPATIHVLCCFSSKGVGALLFCQKTPK